MITKDNILMKKIKNPTACVIIIGNEILSGRTLDTNKHYLCKELTLNGIDVIEARVIKDNKKEIINTVNDVRKKYNYVFTTGGIGPTHDDITSISIANAFKVKLIKNKEALLIIKKFYNSNNETFNKSRQKMALIPKGAELLHNPITKAAGFRIKNVYVMAGIPKIMIAMFKKIIKKINRGIPDTSKTILINFPESCIAEDLELIQKKFNNIEIGSYPFMNGKKKGVNVVLKGRNLNQIRNAEKEIKKIIKLL